MTIGYNMVNEEGRVKEVAGTILVHATGTRRSARSVSRNRSQVGNRNA